MRRQAPPLLARLLAAALPENSRDAVLGDFIEEYALRLHSDRRLAAQRWYYGQIVRSAPPVLWASAFRDSWHVALAIAVPAFFAIGIIEAGLTSAVLDVLTVGEGALPAIGLLIGLGTITAVAYLAALIRPAAATALAILCAAGVAVLMIVAGDESGFWYHLAFLVLGPVAALTGRRLCLRHWRNGSAN